MSDTNSIPATDAERNHLIRAILPTILPAYEKHHPEFLDQLVADAPESVSAYQGAADIADRLLSQGYRLTTTVEYGVKNRATGDMRDGYASYNSALGDSPHFDSPEGSGQVVFRRSTAWDDADYWVHER